MSSDQNFFSKKVSLSRAGFAFTAVILLLLGGTITYLSFRDSFEDKFASYEGFTAPLGEFPVQEAKDMVAYFNYTAQPINTQGRPLYNPPAIHFELGALAHYMLKVSASSLGASGVRVYFGRYVNDTQRTFNNDRYNYKDHSTVIFVATKKDRDGNIVDIVTDNKGNPVTLIQPYNGGVSCPPLPPSNCSGQVLDPRP